jgi:predicted XRE-type DNA-binding protein
MARKKLTQAEAAKRLGVVQPRLSEIACNKVDKLSLDYLVGLCEKAGLSVTVKTAA